MSNDIKTLENVQPGGMVRLGDQAERARFEEWYVQNAFDYEANPIGSRDCALMRKAWNAALSAHPSPGGQDALADAARRVISDVDSSDYGGTISMATYDALVAALAARQPVGEPVIDYEDLVDQAKDLIQCGCSVNGAFDWLLEQLTDGEVLASPAQAVDLDELRRAACVVDVVGQIDGHDVVRRNLVLDVIDIRRQRLADDQAVQS